VIERGDGVVGVVGVVCVCGCGGIVGGGSVVVGMMDGVDGMMVVVIVDVVGSVIGGGGGGMGVVGVGTGGSTGIGTTSVVGLGKALLEFPHFFFLLCLLALRVDVCQVCAGHQANRKQL
jgi:hypothetical protein